jgi:hypothetical protein
MFPINRLRAFRASLCAFCVILCASAPSLSAAVTVTEIHKISGDHTPPGSPKKQSAQGMCIHKDTAFLFNNTGYCRVFNLLTNKVIAEYPMACASPATHETCPVKTPHPTSQCVLVPQNHANCANFGVEFPTDNPDFPALYLSECYGKRRCLVQSVTTKGAKLIQTIRLAINDKSSWPYDRITDTDSLAYARTFDWFVDKENKFLYAIAFAGDFATETAKKGESRSYVLVKLPLPKLADGDITFTQKDILAQFLITFNELSQGGVIRDNKLYLPVGHAQPKRDPNGSLTKPDLKDRALIIVDLNTQKIIANHNFSGDKNGSGKTTREPEDADFHNDTLLIWCGQKGGLWQVKGLK